MNSDLTSFQFAPLFIDIFLGTLSLIIILFLHGGSINHVLMKFEQYTTKNLEKRQYNRVFIHFYASFFFIALSHINEILIWAVFLLGLGLVSNPIEAILFSGSCYTTVGFIGDILPLGWKSLAFFIAFTGLFSLAWTTSVMINMTNTYQKAWRQKYGKHDNV